MKSIVLIAILLLAASNARTQTQEPTYEQSRKWIVAKLNEAGYTHHEWTTLGTGGEGLRPAYATASLDQISMDECNLRYSEILFDSSTEMTFTSSNTIPLAKVSDVTVKHWVIAKSKFNEEWDEWRITIVAPITQKLVEEKRGVVGQELKNTTPDKTEITFGKSPATDEDSVNRLQKALKHAAALCKDKQKNTDKEPF